MDSYLDRGVYPNKQRSLEPCICLCVLWNLVCVYVFFGTLYVFMCSLDPCMCLCVLWNFVCVYVFFGSLYVFRSGFRTLAVIFVLDFAFKRKGVLAVCLQIV